MLTLSAAADQTRGGAEMESWYLVDPSAAQVIENYPTETDEDRIQRRERLSAIRQYAEQLKL